MGNGEGDLENKISRLTVRDPYDMNGNDGLIQVMRAVEAAEATIKQQVEENNQLRFQLQKRNEELEKFKSGELKYQNPQSVGAHVDEPQRMDKITTPFHNQIGVLGNVDFNHGNDLSNLDLQNDLMQNNRDTAMHTQLDSHFNRYQLEGDTDSQIEISRRGLISMSEVNNYNGPKQDLVVKIRDYGEEISQLKKHLAEYSTKESQIRNEKYALEKRISYLRTAFDQQQHDVVDAASQAISYRQDIIEENIRLTYALQAAQQERSTFVSSLMPLLAEYSLQPPIADTQSISSNIKVLFRHFREQFLVTETKLNESHYQLAPWHSDKSPSNFARLPAYPIEINNGTNLVQQQAYSNENMQSSDPHDTSGGDLSDRTQSGFVDDSEKDLEHVELKKYPPFGSRHTASQEVWTDSNQVRNNKENVGKKVKFGDLIRSNEMEELETREPSAYTATFDNPNPSFSPYLPPVLEESSSFSEAADDDPLPAIEGLQISGEAFPGQQLQASGYSTNGTTSCNFEWLRHEEDGSFNYINGARQPNYLVTADDVGTYLAIEVQPLDDRKRKGELVKVFANEHMKINCDPEMQNCIESTLYSGHASFKLSLSTGYLDIWEPATMSIKRDGYSVKCNGPSGVIITEKFSPSTVISIPYGSPDEFSIVDSQGIERALRAENDSEDISGSRDTIVLTMRLFVIKASQKKKVKKRSLFFNK